MLDAGRRIMRIIHGVDKAAFAGNEEKFLSVTKLLEIIGEAARQVSDQTRSEFAAIPWSKLAGTRNRLIHAYFDVDLEVIWNIAQSAVPTLVAELESLLAREPNQ